MPSTADIAAAVVAELNATTFSQPFTAVRAYLPRYELGEMDDLHITVVAAGRTVVPGSRANLQIEHRLEIAGFPRAAVFTEGALKKIFTFSGGYPRLINIVCDRALLIGYTEGRR